MNDSKRVYAIGAGIAAIILVIALALSVMSNQTTKVAPTAAPLPRPTTSPSVYRAPKPVNTTVSQAFSTFPDNTVQQTITVSKKK